MPAGDDDDAAAMAAAPSPIEQHVSRGVRLFEAGNHEAAVECFRAAIRIDGRLVAPHFNLGNALLASGRADEARAAFRLAVSIDPLCSLAYRNLGLSLLDTDGTDDAVAALRRAAELEPADAAVRSGLAVALTRQGEHHQALAMLERNLDRAPHETRDLALEAVLLDHLGDDAGARRLLDFDQLVVTSRPTDFPGYDGMGAFHAALEEHVLSHPSLRPSPVEHATREGLHSGDLLLGNAPVVTTLESLIESAVTRYVEDGTHPFMTTAPVDVVLSAWAVVMGRGGHQLPHVHPAGWLSGVYYLRIPAASAERPDAGSIEFGLPDPKLGLDGTPSTRTVRPEAGSFVLFPSYLYHRTLPNDTSEQRISIAFDVMPDPATQPP